MTEEAIEAVAATMESYLPAELAALNVEYADGITLDDPTRDLSRYARGPLALTEGPRAASEVFSDDAVPPPEPYQSADYNAGRITRDSTVQIRITIAQREPAGDAKALFRKAMRTAKAIARVFVRHYDLDGSAEVVTQLGEQYRNQPGDQLVRSFTSRLVVRTRESVPQL